MTIIGRLKTHIYGECLIGEQFDTGELLPVGEREDNAVNWVEIEGKEYEDKVNNKNLCDSCITKGCIFQSGIVRTRCDFYKSESKPQERNCHFCNHYKDEYCDVHMKPCNPEKGCDFFEPGMSNIQEMYNKVKDLSKRVEVLEKDMIEEKEDKVKKMHQFQKSYIGHWWKCERCGKLIPYMAVFCYECADKILGHSPKPFDSAEMEEA